MVDLIVIGGGPAGMVAAVYALRQRLNVLLIADTLGGKTLIRSEFPGLGETSVIRGGELVDRFKNELDYLSTVLRPDRVRSVGLGNPGSGSPSFVVNTEDGENLECRSVIVASGCRFEPPTIPGAGRYLSKGIGYSGLSYAHLFLDRSVAVIGDGMRAVRSARQLAYSAARVYLLPEGGAFDPRRRAEIETLAESENVTVLPDSTVVSFNGDAYAREVTVRQKDGTEQTLTADGFFLESSAAPNSEMVAQLVDRDADGYIRVDSRNRTSCPGIAAAGDVTDVHHEQVLVAIGEGAKAALSVLEQLFLRP